MFWKRSPVGEDLEAARKLFSEQEREWVTIAIAGASIQMLWAILDYMLVPDQWINILITRLFVFFTIIPMVIFRKKLNISALSCIFLASIEIALFSVYSMSIVPFEAFRFYAFGEIIFFVAVGMVVTWELKYSLFLIFVSIIVFAVLFPLLSTVTVVQMLSNGGIAALTLGILSAVMVNIRFKFRMREIEARMQLERSLKLINEKNSEIEVLSSNLKNKERDFLTSEITSTIAHQLNTPLSVVIHSVETIQKQVDSFIKFGFRGIEHSEIFYLLNLLKEHSIVQSTILTSERSEQILRFAQDTAGISLKKNDTMDLAFMGVTSDDQEFLSRILSKKNISDHVALLKEMKLLDEMLKNVLVTSDKMSLIVKDISRVEELETGIELIPLDIRMLVEKAFNVIQHSGRFAGNLSLIEIKKDTIYHNELKIVLFLIKLMDYVIVHSSIDKTEVLNVIMTTENGITEINLRITQSFAQYYTAEKMLENGTRSESKLTDTKDLDRVILRSMCEELNVKSEIVQDNENYFLKIKVPGIKGA
ncbi:MAG: hypothetical protein ACK46O_06865 [Flavobacteriia bacterium]